MVPAGQAVFAVMGRSDKVLSLARGSQLLKVQLEQCSSMNVYEYMLCVIVYEYMLCLFHHHTEPGFS
jgi:hypothetical protein